MDRTFPDLIRRVGKIINDQREWFETVSRWYENAKLTREVVFNLWVPGAPTCLPRLTLNGQVLENGVKNGKALEHRHFWILPPSLLHAGENDVILWIERRSGPPVSFGNITVEHAAALPAEVRGDSRPSPLPSEQVSVTLRLGEAFRQQADRWSAQIQHDTLKFNVKLGDPLPDDLMLGVAALLPGSGYAVNVEFLWKLVGDLVKKKLEELLLQESQGQRVGREIEDVKAYDKLHRGPLRDAVQGPATTTLESVQHRNGKLPATNGKPIEPATATRAKPPRQTKSLAGCSGFMTILVLVVIVAIVAWGNGWIGAGTLGKIQAAWNGLVNGGRNAAERARENQIAQVLDKKGAQSGDVQVSLYWTNKNDLDLHVIAPSGERVNFQNRNSRCKGKLDVDMNVNYVQASTQAVENIFWPTNQSPRGHYKVEVHYYRNHGQPDCPDATPFTVRLVVKGTTRWFHGEMAQNRRVVTLHEFDVN